MFNLEGKIAIVTGPSGNLGPIWVETLENAGAEVFGIDLPDDITDKENIKKLLSSWWKIKPIPHAPDIIVNNAGIDNPPGSKASFFGNCKEILDVNLQGAVNICEVFIPYMIHKDGGVIVNIGSIQGNIGADWRNYDEGFEKPVGYNLSKAGLIQLSRSICTQYGRYNIRSVTISFGPFEGAGFDLDFREKFLKNVPLGRTISKESLQTSLLYACCCPELSGQQVLIDGGYCGW